MFLYSSSPKSGIALAFLSQGFQTTTSGSPSFLKTSVLFFSWSMITIFCGALKYTLSTSDSNTTASPCSVQRVLDCRLSK
uniref:Uncharacterized protein n=1 Tax=Arundo donax TaxID=35708 RepID=A0A0A9GUL4_ARUDO